MKIASCCVIPSKKNKKPVGLLSLFGIVLHCLEHLERSGFLLGGQADPTVEKFLHVRGQLYHIRISEELR